MKLLITDKLFKRPCYRETVSQLILQVSCGSYSVIYTEPRVSHRMRTRCIHELSYRLGETTSLLRRHMNATFIVSTKPVLVMFFLCLSLSDTCSASFRHFLRLFKVAERRVCISRRQHFYKNKLKRVC